MFRHFYLVVAVGLILLLTLSACGQKQTTEAINLQAASAIALTCAGLNDDAATVRQIPLEPATEAFSTVEVVKILTPSVVQVLTEALAMDAFNQPGVGMGLGTGVILDVQGNILTNNHVIAGCRPYRPHAVCRASEDA